MDINVNEEKKRLRIERIESCKSSLKMYQKFSKISAFFTCILALFAILSAHGLYEGTMQIIMTLLTSLESAFYSLSWSKDKQEIKDYKNKINYLQNELRELEKEAVATK